MNKAQRMAIHQKYHGHCAYCGTIIDMEDMQADHIIPKSQCGKDEIGNFNPSCRRCNHYKRGMDLEGFRHSMIGLHKRINDIYIVKVGLNFGMVEIRLFDGMFYFERGETEKFPRTDLLDAIIFANQAVAQAKDSGELEAAKKRYDDIIHKKKNGEAE